MFKNAVLSAALAGFVAATALATTTTGADAGKKFYFSVQPQGVERSGSQAHLCRHWKRKWRRTGQQHFLRKYRNCLLHSD